MSRNLGAFRRNAFRVFRAITFVSLFLGALYTCNAGRVQPGEWATQEENALDGNTSDPNTQTGEVLAGAKNTFVDDGTGLVIYWGQNENSKEKTLSETCDQNQYNTIVIGFIFEFGKENIQDANGYPSVNFSNHCQTPFDSKNPNFLNCPDIGEDIVYCQNKGKKILLSMGGAVGKYGFSDDNDADTVATKIWNVFLGGTDTKRPFGSAVLDGIDLDVETGNTNGYTAFVTKLYQLAKLDGRKKYYITAAPQCVFPDTVMGGDPSSQGKVLTDVPHYIDYVFVQFYNNNSCQTSSPQGWPTALAAWAGLYSSDGGPKLFMGLPAAEAAANEGYLNPNNIDSVFKTLRTYNAAGGVMLWDVAYDVASSGPYSDSVKKSLQKSGT